ncbi:MAG: 3'-5' exonuclease [Bacteroidetes bacterium]|nr:3'-5' exonuclease [Bacteroidota bacterium]
MYTIIDIESNGAGFRKESIIEVAIYKYDGHQIVDQFITLVNPEAEITPFVQKLTGISSKMVKTAPKFHEIAKRIVEITEGTTLVGHNIEFDFRMLKQSFERLGYHYQIETLDTIPLAKKLIPNAESYSLGKLVRSLGIPLTDHHRAAGDARATLELFKLLLTKDAVHEIIQQQYEETQAKTFNNKIKELTTHLPNTRGIVYFQDVQGTILHSDYTENIHRYAKNVLQSKSSKRKSIQNRCEQISFETTGNLLLSKLIVLSKNMKWKESLPYALYYHHQQFWIEKKMMQKGHAPLLYFKSYTQGLKALSFIKKNFEPLSEENLNTKIQIENKTGLLSGEGRVLGEKVFLVINKGKLVSFGFYEYHTQIQSKKKLALLSMDLPEVGTEVYNEIRLSLLRGDVQWLQQSK